jgi:hypothetical protein
VEAVEIQEMKEAKVIYEKWINGDKILTEESTVASMTDFQKAFLAKGTGQKLFTEDEVNAQIDGIIKSFEGMAMEYVVKEREACAKIAHDMDRERHGIPESDRFTSDIARAILMRLSHDKTGATVSTIDKP